ncbi:MAG: hypothetical protein LUP99_00435, partial [Methanomicrobiales archaeon]|nr:hypothetical protein [Methanomicrobiales archaeon]
MVITLMMILVGVALVGPVAARDCANPQIIASGDTIYAYERHLDLSTLFGTTGSGTLGYFTDLTKPAAFEIAVANISNFDVSNKA